MYFVYFGLQQQVNAIRTAAKDVRSGWEGDVPDAIPMIGWLDDVTLLAFVIGSIRFDLDAFQQWEKAEAGTAAEEMVNLD